MVKIEKSLSNIHRSISIKDGAGTFKKTLAFIGPAYLVSVGYMDPGNWATDIEGGSRFGYSLLWVLLMSNLMAVVLQTLAARLGIVSGQDLAQACRANYSRSINFVLWLFAEIAIAATDLAEILGTAVGLNLLFNLPMLWGVVLTGFDTFIFLAIQNLGMKKFESFIIFLIAMVGLCFVVEVFLAKPDWTSVVKGFVPTLPKNSVYVILGIVGATIMPHNLFLHSSLVQTRAYDTSDKGKKQACRFNFVDTFIALNLAFFVNAAILVVSAAVFHKNGVLVTELKQAHQLLSPLLGTGLAGAVFALALLSAGQASTLTGTLSGQIVMEGYLRFRVRPALRRFFTRFLALVPAVITIWIAGPSASFRLLILSQVILSLQLPFTIIPLMHFTNDKKIMGEFTSRFWLKSLTWLIIVIITCLNIKLVFDEIAGLVYAATTEVEIFFTYVVVGPIVFLIGAFLLYISIKPLIKKFTLTETIPTWKKFVEFVQDPHDRLEIDSPTYKRIGVAISHKDTDKAVVGHALKLARLYDSALCLLHVVEGAGSLIHGNDSYDSETRQDETYLLHLAKALSHKGVRVEISLGFGHVADELVRLTIKENLDLLVMGSHGHRGISALFFGSTISPVRQKLKIPVLLVR